LVAVTGGALAPLLAVPARGGPLLAVAARAADTATTAPPPPPASTTLTPPPPANPNPARVSVRVTHSGVSQPIPSGFVGFSFEFQAVRDYTGSDPHAINPVLVQLIRDVAPGQTPVLRIGGDSTDGTWWPVPDVTPSPGISYTLTKSWLATTRALAVATGAKLILGVNLKLDSVAEAAAEARAYRTGIGTRHIDALEIGNEPELYKVFPWYEEGAVPFYARPPTYDFASYAEDVSQVAGRVPGLPLAGPATGDSSWLARVPRLLAFERRLKVVTYHRYPLISCFSQPGDRRYPSITNLLDSDAARDLLQGAGTTIASAHRHGATVRIDELNSVACEGQPGVSDTFASALWMLDTLFAMVRAGVDGVNIHTLPDAAYEPFVFRRIRGRWLATVRPEYYSLLTFAEAAPPGSRMLSIDQTASTDVRSRATVTGDGVVHVVVINASLTSGHVVLVRPPARARVAVLERLRAPSAAATDDVTLGGQTFGNETGTGTLKGTLRTVSLTPDRRGRYLIRMPASSAAMLTFVPAAKPPVPIMRPRARRADGARRHS
jgi:Glycosyl hydrolase family 79 C-terminal beta domain